MHSTALCRLNLHTKCNTMGDAKYQASVTSLPVVYGLPRKRKRLIELLAVRGAPAVVYPASGLGPCEVARADMESASQRSQSVQAAGKLPRQLPASSCVGVTRGAMMGDQSRRNAGRGTWFSSFKTGFGALPSRHLGLVRHFVSQARVADARELVGQRAGGLVVTRPGLHLQGPALERV